MPIGKGFNKIVFQARTTHGGVVGPVGPVFNGHGKVVGITYADLNGFGGFNLAIPIRLSQSLLAQK